MAKVWPQEFQMFTRWETRLFGFVLILLTINASAKIDSVLEIIPNTAVGLIHVGNLKGFNQEVGDLMAQMDPTSDPDTDVLVAILANMFSAGFESLDELEEIGFDFSRGFAIFMHTNESNVGNPLAVSAVVHVANKEDVRQMLSQEEGDLVEQKYRGTTYLTKPDDEEEGKSADSASFLFLDNVMVFTSIRSVCHQVIETYLREAKSITKSANFSDLQLNSSVNDVAAYFAIQRLVEDNQTMITEFFGRVSQETGQTEILKTMSQWLSQIHSLSLTLEHDKGEIVLTPFLQMISDSQISNYLEPFDKNITSRTGPENFPLLKYIPEASGMAYGMNLDTDKIAEIAIWSMNMGVQMLKLSGEEKIPDNAEELSTKIAALASEFYESVGPQSAGFNNISSSVIPDLTQIYKVTDQKKLEQLIDNGYFQLMYGSNSLIYQAMGLNESDSAVKVGSTEIYEGVEIKNYILPNQGIGNLDLFDDSQLGGMMPSELHLYYAIFEQFLVVSTAETPQAIKSVIDTCLGLDNGFDQSAGYDRLFDELDSSGYMVMAISPLTMINQILNVVAQSDPNIGMVAALLAGIPQTYSIAMGVASKKNGLEIKLFTSVVELQQLYGMIMAMGQMQGRM